MNEQAKRAAQMDEWRGLISSLPGVLNAQFGIENGQVCEVHVLSNQTRSPKQIARDIQSAMAARFQIDLDHRIISVAQIPGVGELPNKRIQCDRLTVSSGRTGTQISVVLSLNGLEQSATAEAPGSPDARRRAIAEATVAAINSFLAASVRFSVSDINISPIGSEHAVLVGVLLHHGDRTEHLLGSCYEGKDVNLSVVQATLDGVNRRILTLAFSS